MNERYTIEKELNKDFLSTHYQGADTVLNRNVAIRSFSKDYLHDDWQDMLSHVTAGLSSVQHPNITQVFDIGINADGVFIVSAETAGTSMIDLMAQGAMSVAEVHNMASHVLDAYTSIHSVGQVHGEITTHSIIQIVGPGGRAKYHIADFGVTMLKPMMSFVSEITYPMFAAPEVLNTCVSSATASSDLYMLGQLCYTLLAGGHPYGAKSKADIHSLYSLDQMDCISAYVPDTPPEFVAWIKKLIAANPADRHSSALEALNTLPSITAPMARTA